MAASSFRSATVEEYDEGPSDNDACGGAPPYAEGSAGIVPLMTPAYQHPPCEPPEPPQSYPAPAQPVQPVRQYPPEAHHHQQTPGPHGDVEPPSPPFPKVPTPPHNPPPKKSRRKPSSSSRRRNKDRPEYYGIRGPSTAVVPAIPPDALPHSSNIRIARRPTTGWYVSGAGSPPGATADPAPGHAANSPPRIHGPPANSNRLPRDEPPVNTFRNSGIVQLRGQQPPPPNHDDDSRGWETAEAHNRGLETPHPHGGPHDYPPAQPTRSGPGFIVLNQGHGGPPHEPNAQAHGMESGWDPQPLPPPPQGPPQHNSHGVVVLSSNSSRPAGPPNEPPPQRSFYQIPSQDDQRRSPSPPYHPPMPQYDERAAAHQIPGRQSVHPVHSPPAQPRNGYRRQRDQSPQDTPPSPTPGPYQEFQRLSLEDTPPNDRRTRQTPAHPEPARFRSHDAPAPPSRSDSASSPNGPSVHTPSHGPHGRQRGGYPAANEPVRHTPHPQRRNPHDLQPPAQRRPPADAPAPPSPGDWAESPRQQWNPKTPHPQHPQHGFYPIPEESNHVVPPQRQIEYPVKPSRAIPPQGSYHRRDSYPGPEEDFESDAHEPNTSWPHKHQEDTPTLPEGHPFLRMKDMALATILKEFRAWQSAGMPGRRGPHPRRPPFSCPFAKRDPLRHKDCFSDALPGIADVKEHVSRCHSIPIYCPRCMDLFDDEKARDHHVRYAGCHPQQWSTPDGVTESQKRQLRSGVPTYLPPPDQWSHIYSIIFQQQARAPPPESPYVDDTLHEDVSTFGDFLETRGPRALSDVLTFRGAATWNLPNEERDLTAFRCLVLEEGVRDLVDQWARRSDSLRSPSSLASSSGAAGDQQRTPSMGSFASSEGARGGGGGGYAPASPVEAHHWDPRPRIREEPWDDYGGHPAGQAELADPRRQKAPMYGVPRREAGPY